MSSEGVGTKGMPRPEREAEIVAAATAEFAGSGYARASMVTIAARAGISKPLVYQYFGSKDRLYLACLHEVAATLLTRLEDAEHSVDDSVVSRIHPLRAVFTALEPQREAWRLLFDVSMTSEGELAGVAADYRRRATAIAAAGCERFLKARGIDDQLDGDALTVVWMGVIDSLVNWWLTHPDEPASIMIERCGRLLTAITDRPI